MDKLRIRMLAGGLLCAGSLCGVAGAAHHGLHLPTPVLANHAFDCATHACVMPAAGAYPYLIIGHFQAKATPSQSRRLFKAMRAQGHWQQLPASAKTFQSDLQPVAIRLADGSILAVLMTSAEARVARPHSGDLVRYSPHRGKYEIPPEDPVQRAWWSVDGCVAILCRVGDAACFKRYRPGVYRPADGVAISAHTFKPLPHHVAIDPDSLLPAAG